MQLPNTKILIIVAGAILVILIAVTIFVSGLTNKNQTSQQQPTLIPTGIFESSGESGQNQNPNTPTLTKEQLLSEIPNMTSGATDYLTGDQLAAFNALKNKLPYSSSRLDIKYSPEVNQFIVSKKTPNADSELNKFLEENNFLGTYQADPGLFVIGSDPIDTLVKNRQNDLINTLQEQNGSSVNNNQEQQNKQQNKSTSQQEIENEAQSFSKLVESLMSLNFIDEIKIKQSDTQPSGGGGNGGGSGGGGLPPPQSYKGGGTPQLKQILSVLKAIPGITWGGVCANPAAGGHMSNSEHYYCNAVDVFGGETLLDNTFANFLAAAKNNELPIHCLIYERFSYSRDVNNWAKTPYTGDSTHDNHIHISGWPSVGGAC